ncbi:DMT family transporter [Anaerobacillus sp. MEB173]|uniref:DMT family transporter n=1 Tax=Anaerobacillus sp. MEB173 TaxID=3383345 RepID=UPI003F8FF76C
MSDLISRVQRYPYVLLVLATFFWGTNFVFGKVLVETIPPFHIALMRWIVAILVFLPFVWKDFIKHKQLLLKNWKILFFLALTGVAGFNTLLYIAVQYTTSINASLVNSTAPLLIVLLSVIFLREQLVRFQIVGVIVSFVGVIVVISQGSIERLLQLSFNPGDIFVVSAVISWSIYSILMKKYGVTLPKTATFAATMIIGLLILLPFTVWESSTTEFAVAQLSLTHWLGIMYLGIFPSIVSFICWNEGVVQVGPGKSSNYLHLIVVFTGIIAVMIGETYTIIQFIGGVLILTGVFFASNQSLLKRRPVTVKS